MDKMLLWQFRIISQFVSNLPGSSPSKRFKHNIASDFFTNNFLLGLACMKKGV